MTSSDHVTLALAATGVRVDVLGEAERKNLLKKLLDRFGIDLARRAPWDTDAAPDGCLRPDGWQLTAKYVGASTCLLMVAGARDVWRFRDGADLLRILEECPALEFYVCDESASYLLCSNHHDVLIGWGSAKAWVEELDNCANKQ